ncbi:MAG: lycopene beta-cyclase CrtY [Deltaproteobacteria bacterium]|nr:lycopene beta-cyclase CrtY [Deltaproteobacteria bacterium]
MPPYEYILVGGGLHNAILSLAILQRRPGARVLLLEREANLGGNHTWCFHAGDVPAEAMAWMRPLVAHRWSGFQVRFPNLERGWSQPYSAITSERLDRVVRQAFAASGQSEIRLGASAARVDAHSVTLEDGSVIRGELVVDARGPTVGSKASAGYQKFVGVEVETRAPHGVLQPVIMDATVAQEDGYRFVYLLPLSDTRCLVEDTRFSDTPRLDRDAVRQSALAYIQGKGWAVERIVREEHGVLPMPWQAGAPSEAPLSSPLPAGYAAGWFHPATGYSLPLAVRLALHVSGCEPASVFGAELDRLWSRQRSQARFFHVLNWMLFNLVEPRERWKLFARFHTLPEDTILRFYAMRTTLGDRARILSGRPPQGLRLRRLFEQAHEI